MIVESMLMGGDAVDVIPAVMVIGSVPVIVFGRDSETRELVGVISLRDSQIVVIVVDFDLE